MTARDTVVQLETVRTIAHLNRQQQALRAEQRTLAERALSADAIAGLVVATVHAHADELRGDPGPPGKDGRPATQTQADRALAKWLPENLPTALAEAIQPHLADLRGADGQTPTTQELTALIEGLIASQPERFRGLPGAPGRGIASMRLRADDMLEVTWTDGATESFGPLVTERQTKTTERQVIVTGGGADRPTYTQALTGTEVVIPAATHGLPTVHHVQLTDPDGDIAYACVRVSPAEVRITALIDLSGYTATLE